MNCPRSWTRRTASYFSFANSWTSIALIRTSFFGGPLVGPQADQNFQKCLRPLYMGVYGMVFRGGESISCIRSSKFLCSTMTSFFNFDKNWGIIKTAEFRQFDRKNGFPTPKNHTVDTHMLWVCSTGAKVINLQDEMSKILNKQECIIFQLCRFLNKHCLDQ